MNQICGSDSRYRRPDAGTDSKKRKQEKHDEKENKNRTATLETTAG
jgi:hypothetical protein